ncbi:DUF6345 domain-containing protein [Siphonobacter sp. SORGH_AS_0500]|uniref:DUF6345 domain-containing protein n=1 Tax=Siphonobacter sp. SORGH_AS_0500 TaxID=1864824 RepID=UPI0028644452|nr:DUF6345 domain-containing protein [Siphonobacter sp. SORGH_AS_0500]MDR6196043.1 hypothetical protein [Siphonobacter sp. SORGH_AS_0500]
MKLVRMQLPTPLAEHFQSLNLGGSDDVYGANSIQIFPQYVDASGVQNANLTRTHADARGFLDWLGTWNRGNFWYQDGGVNVWAYEETFDNWQDTYGQDAVLIFYHSGHGGMDFSNGNYFVPMGGTWDNRNEAASTRMRVGNETAKYLFWSTCQSLKVPDVVPDNPNHLAPWSTWDSPTNQGLRMIFGFHTNSYDHADYGKNFGKNYNAGQTFRNAWINASWAIAHNQIATVATSGSNQQEALQRLNTERLFQWSAVARNWWAWSWTGGFTQPFPMMAELQKPTQLEVLLLGARQFDEKRVAALASELGFSRKEVENMGFLKDGSLAVLNGKGRLLVDEEGRFQATLATANLGNTRAIAKDRAITIAQKWIKDLNFEREGITLKFDSLRPTMMQAGTREGSGRLEEPFVSDTTVVFRQTANGLDSVNANHGLVMVTVDNDGTVTHLHNSTRVVEGTSSVPRLMPGIPKNAASALWSDEALLNQQFQQKLTSEGVLRETSKTLDATLLESKTGYDFSGAQSAGIVVQRDYERASGTLTAKRYKVRVPLFA